MYRSFVCSLIAASCRLALLGPFCVCPCSCGWSSASPITFALLGSSFVCPHLMWVESTSLIFFNHLAPKPTTCQVPNNSLSISTQHFVSRSCHALLLVPGPITVPVPHPISMLLHLSELNKSASLIIFSWVYLEEYCHPHNTVLHHRGLQHINCLHILTCPPMMHHLQQPWHCPPPPCPPDASQHCLVAPLWQIGHLLYIFTCPHMPHQLQQTSLNLALHVYPLTYSLILFLCFIVGSSSIINNFTNCPHSNYQCMNRCHACTFHCPGSKFECLLTKCTPIIFSFKIKEDPAPGQWIHWCGFATEPHPNPGLAWGTRHLILSQSTKPQSSRPMLYHLAQASSPIFCSQTLLLTTSSQCFFWLLWEGCYYSS